MTTKNTNVNTNNEGLLTAINFLTTSIANYSGIDVANVKKRVKSDNELELTFELLNQLDAKLRNDFLTNLRQGK